MLPPVLLLDTSFRTEKQSEDKVLGRIFPGHHGPTRRDIPDPGPGMSWTKTLCKAPFVCFIQGMAAISRDFARDFPDQNNFMQENYGLIYSCLILAVLLNLAKQLSGFTCSKG